MIRLVILDDDEKVLALKDIATLTELVNLEEQARNMIRDCQRLAREKTPNGSKGQGMPYLT